MEQQTLDLIPVVACVIKYDTIVAPPIGLQFAESQDDSPNFLMGCRLPEKNYGSLWECPGGAGKEGETPTDTAIRELKEELDLVVRTSAMRPVFEITIPGYHVKFLYVAVAGNMAMKLTAHSEVKLIQLSKMHQYPLTPATAAFMIYLLQRRLAP